MSHKIPFLLVLVLVFGGCASGPKRTLNYTVPVFDYEQHEPKFTHDPLHPTP